MASSSNAINNTPQSPMVDLWTSLNVPQDEACESSTSSGSLQSTIRAVNWVVENRGGFALVTGLLLVPSQFLGSNLTQSESIFSDVCQPRNGVAYAESGSVWKDGINLRFMIYYPQGVENTDRSKCVLYHNPNGITVAGYFPNGPQIEWTPREIANLNAHPIILYDYRGTGINLDVEANSSSLGSFKPTYQTVINDGKVMLQFALEQFEHVDIWGSSLGGGVATVSLERHLRNHFNDASRVTLTNHDSFTTTPEVVLPRLGRVAKWLGGGLGALIDAQESMRWILDTTTIATTILCHTQDPVIPQGARMAEFVGMMPPKDNVRIILSEQYGHANLSLDMLCHLRG